MSDMTSQAAAELDLAIIGALQLNPRADWADLAAALQYSPKTLARRWKLLSESGSAWIAVAPGPAFLQFGCAAWLAITCRPQSKHDVAEALIAEPAVDTVSSTSGTSDFHVIVFVSSIADLTRLLTDRIEVIEGIRSVATTVVLTNYTESARWRVQALDLEQAHLLQLPQVAPTRRKTIPFLDDLDRSLLGALAKDGRQAWTTLGEQCDVTGPTARRRVERLIDGGRVALRCEGANTLVGPVVETTFMITTAPSELNTVGNLLSRIPKCRIANATTGTSTIVATMWFQTIGEIAPFAAALTRELPSITISDRFISLHTFKRAGHVLDQDGRTTGLIPRAIF